MPPLLTPELSSGQPTGPTSATPMPARWLGVGGLLPFALLAAACVLDHDPARRPFWVHAQLAYGAVIASFVGALQWAFAMLLPGLSARAAGVMMLWSVIPALIAWGALLVPPAQGLVALVGILVLALRADMIVAQRHPLPPWFLGLRLRLTLGAVLSLLLTLWS